MSSIPAAMKARPIAGRTSQRRHKALLVLASILFIGMIVLRGELILNLRTVFPSGPDANPSPIESPLELAPIVFTKQAATPPLMTKKKPPPQLPKVALLFLTRGPMPLESIWRDFLGVDSNYTPLENVATTAAWQKYFSIYVHTAPGFKYPPESIFAPFTVKDPVQAQWGDHSIIDAERKLIKAALEEPLNSYFVLLSETHVPLYSASATYLHFATAEHSRIHACGNSSEADRNRRMTYRMVDEMKLVNSDITDDTWRKSSQWFGLIRSHARLVAEESIVDTAFKQYCYILPNTEEEGAYTRFCVSDEHYIPTMLAINNRENECKCDGHVTRVVWTGNFMHPKSFGKAEATADILRHELRGEEECQQGKVLESIADKVLRKIDQLVEDAGEVSDDDNEGSKEEAEEEAKEVNISDLNGAELINYVMKSENVVVMLASCPLFARKIEKEAEGEWRELLKTVLKPTK